MDGQGLTIEETRRVKAYVESFGKQEEPFLPDPYPVKKKKRDDFSSLLTKKDAEKNDSDK